MIDKNDCILIGECVKLHGVKGELVIRLNKGIAIEDLDAVFMYFELDGGLVPFKIKALRPKNYTDILVSFYDTGNESIVDKLLSSAVFVEAGDVDIEDHDINDLSVFVGWSVTAAGLGNMGVITDVIDITNNPVFIIDHDGAEILVPANDDFIERIDEEEKNIYFSLPEGLISIND